MKRYIIAIVIVAIAAILFHIFSTHVHKNELKGNASIKISGPVKS